jgi:hypothetical protein
VFHSSQDPGSILPNQNTWKSFDEHFQMNNWFAKAKHLQDNFSDFCEIFGGVTII